MHVNDQIDIRRLVESDLNDLIAIREVAFLDTLSRTNDAVRQRHVETLEYKRGVFIDDRLVSSASWYPLEIHLYGRRHRIYGLASVVSDPAFRRRGYVGDLLVDGLRRLHQRGVAWCLEYPFDTRFYRKYGWHTVSNGSFFEVPLARLAEFKREPNARRVDADDETACAAIREIYGDWASRFNFTLTDRAKVLGGWSRILTGQPWDESERLIYLMDEAYVVLELSDNSECQRVNVIDFAYRSPSGRGAMLSLLSRFEGQSDLLRLQLPTRDPLAYEWSNFSVEHPHPLHARVVDVSRALEVLRPHDIDAVLRVHDDLCPWNDGSFHIVSDVDGVAVSRVDTAGDLDVDIRHLARLLSGTVDAPTAFATGAVEGKRGALDALLENVQRPSHMPLSDYF